MSVTAPSHQVRASAEQDSQDVHKDHAARFGEKWSHIVIVLLSGGPRRFNQLKRQIPGVSQQMLARTLRSLERDGLIIRTVFPTTPPQVEYTITGLGLSLSERVRALGEWALQHAEQIEAARAQYDVR
jgi:DNA-binding HxlR family transcriptional regulator